MNKLFHLLRKQNLLGTTNEKIAQHWDDVSIPTGSTTARKLRWWQSKPIKEHIQNKIYHSKQGKGFVGAAHYKYNILPCRQGISVGCGDAAKEMRLLTEGFVERFDLYELSSERIKIGQQKAKELGVTDRVNFFQGDVFKIPNLANRYDLVYWDNSLHHMLDVEQAVSWSFDVLKPGGALMMNDFVGATRFQWSDTQIYYASRVRNIFKNSKYLLDPKNDAKTLPIKIKRPTISGMIAADPSEAADSGRIVEMLRKYFPNVEIKPTGGAIYHLALNDMLANFDDISDAKLFDLLLLIDDLLVELGETHYSVAYATKTKNPIQD